MADRPISLLHGVEAIVNDALSIANHRHRSALTPGLAFDGPALVRRIYSTIAANYDAAGATENKDRSRENWRWHYPQVQIAPHNRSPEVVIERAIAAACVTLGRVDWANQIPVASGLVKGAGDGRRAIDLVQRLGQHHFKMIEFKIASDTPLYAAVEIIGYACLWLIARSDRPSRPSPLLDASKMDLRVLAPPPYYARYSLSGIERELDDGVRSLAQSEGVAFSFAFEVLDERVNAEGMPDPRTLLQLIEKPSRATVA